MEKSASMHATSLNLAGYQAHAEVAQKGKYDDSS